MLSKPPIRILGIGLLGLAVLASPAVAWESEAELLATLANENAPLFDKTLACKQLAVVGTEAAVPVLAALLDDERLSHFARYGLEPIPSGQVDEVFRVALSTLEGPHLIGVINSIANRGKAEAIGPLAEKLDDTDLAVAAAAAHSIARLGTPQAGRILEKAMSAPLAAAGLVCGKTLATQGHRDQAIDLLVLVSELEGAPRHVRLAAMLQAVAMQQNEGLETLASALRSRDKATFNTGLRTTRLLRGAGAARVVIKVIKDATPAQQVQLITLLGDLADASALPTVIQAASSGDQAVRISAVAALASLGSADHLTLLMNATRDASSEVSAQAHKTLAALSGDDVDQAVLNLLNDEGHQATVIRLIGRRRITSAMPKLLTLVNGPHQRVVVEALGETVSLEEIDVLGKLLAANSAELREAARSAMHAACNRMPDRDATAAKLSEYLRGASEETTRFVMEQLRLTGGAKALSTVALAAGGDDDVLKDHATRALGAWLDTSAGPVLLELAKSEADGKLGIRGMRGYIRLARQFSMPEEERMAMCRFALETAGRDNEQLLVLQVLERYPSVAALEIAVDAAGTPTLKDAATRTARVIAKKIGGQSNRAQALLKQISQKGD